MKAYLIDPQTRTITVQEFDGRQPSLFTLFGSLLVDTNDILNDHMVYTAREAFEEGEAGYFLGEKLLFGKALVTGYAGFEDLDAAITQEELESLLMYELPRFYRETLALLPKTFSFEERYAVQTGGETAEITPEWVFYVFNMADENTKRYFLSHLEETATRGEDIHEYLKKMADLAIRSTS